MTAYYNEIDPYAAAWLRNLIAKGHIAPGDVDERSIEDVSPDDLRRYTQCHFFAGIGVWSYALRLAGWPDDRPIWTGSCPCQPFSAAGKGGGFADERHLWPAFHWLISQCGPDVVLGEQVASKDGLSWLDLVLFDLEGTNYACGAADNCAAGVGAPHIRQRLWWFAERAGMDSRNRVRARALPWLERLADDQGEQRQWEGHQPGERSSACGEGSAARGRGDAGRLAGAERRDSEFDVGTRTGSYAAPSGRPPGGPERCGNAGRMDDNDNARLEGFGGGPVAAFGHGQGSVRPIAETGELGGLADRDRSSAQRRDASEVRGLSEAQREPELGAALFGRGGRDGRPGPVNGLWRDADWLFCRDGKWRPVEPGTFPLAHGAASRVGRLRAYGNAIVAQAAQEFIESYIEAGADL